MIGLSSAATCTGAGLISFAPELWHKNKTPARLERAGAEKQCSEVTGDHRRSEKVQKLHNRLGDRARAATIE